MSASQFMGFGARIFLVAFIVFAFRQGLQVKPNRDVKDNWQGLPPDSPPN